MNTKDNMYDTPIPIDKVLLKDGSEPSDLPSTSGAPAHLNEDGTRTSSEIPPSLAYNDGMEASVIEQPTLDVVQEASETRSQVSGSAHASGSVHASGSAHASGSGVGSGTQIVPQTVPLLYPGAGAGSLKPPEQGSVLSVHSSTSSKVPSHHSNVTVRSDHSSITGSQIRHEPITSATFVPKSILKNKFGRESSSESESSEDEAEEAEQENERYHLTIPMEEGAA